MGRLDGQGVRDHRRGRRHRRRDGAAVRRARARRSSASTSHDGRAAATSSLAGRRDRRGRGRGDVRAGARALRAHRRALQQRRHLAGRRRARCSTPSLEAWQRVQDVNLKSVFLCCKHGIPHLLENDGPRRLGHQHRVVRRRHGRGDVADLLHRVQGRRARACRASSAWSSRAGACASTRCARGRSTRRCCSELFAKDPEQAARRLVHVPMGRFAQAREIANGGAVPGRATSRRT